MSCSLILGLICGCGDMTFIIRVIRLFRLTLYDKILDFILYVYKVNTSMQTSGLWIESEKKKKKRRREEKRSNAEGSKGERVQARERRR